jgi:amino acid transporter
VFAFVGWENSGPLAEESRDPRRTIPRTVVLSIAITTVVFFLAAYALVVGFAGWQGASTGMASIGTLGNPYLTLTGQYAPWLKLVMFLIGVTSSFGCYLAAGLPGSRYIFHGARAGLLPSPLARISSKTSAPTAAIAVYVGLITVATVLLDIWLRDPVKIASYEAGISTVPLLIIYGTTCVRLPFFVWRTDRGTFSVVRHVVLPLIGLAVVGYGVWESINPGRPRRRTGTGSTCSPTPPWPASVACTRSARAARRLRCSPAV